MKKLICLIRHNLRLMKINECDTEKFENDDRAILVYKCKYCGADVTLRTLYLKAHITKEMEKKMFDKNVFK